VCHRLLQLRYRTTRFRLLAGLPVTPSMSRLVRALHPRHTGVGPGSSPCCAVGTGDLGVAQGRRGYRPGCALQPHRDDIDLGMREPS
jgi:hypothetical protein